MKKRRPVLKHTFLAKILREVTLGRRGIILILSASIVIVAILAAAIARNSLPVKLTDADRAMLTQYELIRVALSQDNLGLAQKAAATIAGSYEDRRRIVASGLALSKADSLESARDAFSTMSSDAVKMVRGHKEYYVIGCSMNECPAPCVNCQMSRFSDWVQSDPAIVNPFMGKASPHCGVIKQ